MCSAHKRVRTQECAASTDLRDVLNSLRSEEDEAFRFLLYAIAVIAVIVALVLIGRAVF